MIITVHPSDLIKRCLWNEYKRYCLVDKSEEEVDDIIINDNSFIISEDDAYVIGLLKVVETDNLIHRFKVFIEDLLKVRSNLFDNKLYINRNIIINNVATFKKRFPESYKPPMEYKIAIDELNKFIDDISYKIEELKIYPKTINEKNYVFVLSNDVKSVLNS